MAEAVGAVDRDAPRQRRRRAVQLLVEVVAPPADRLHHEQGRRDDVGPARERHAAAARVPPGRQRAGHDAAVDAEPRIRRQDDLERIVRVERPLVDDVVQPAADQGRDRHDDDAVADDVGVLAGGARQADEHDVRGRQPDRVTEPVPADRDGTELERDGIGRDVEHARSVAAAARPAMRPYTSRR